MTRCCPRVGYVAATLLILVSTCLAGENDWPAWRQNTALTGHTPLKGDMTSAPRVAWTFPLTGMKGLLVMEPGQPGVRAADRRSGQFGDDYLSQASEQWGMQPHVYSLPNGERLVLTETAEKRCGRIHPGLPEPQQVVMTGKAADARIRLYAWDTPDGQKREVWSSPAGKVAHERWNICFGDIDADGVEEIIAAGHGGVMCYDPRDGTLESELHYGHRSRGFVGVADIDDDGAVEFLDIGLFQIGIEVCDYQDGELKLLWGDKIELDIFAHPRMINTPFDALCDLQGDGQMYVVYNMYNDETDRQWHLIVRDAISGEVRWDIPRFFLNDSVDLDGDGVRELVGIHTEGRFCQGFGPASIAHLGPSGLEELWTHPEARWPLRQVLDMPRDRSTFRSAGGHVQVCQGDLDGDGRTELLFSEMQKGGSGREVFGVVGPDADGGYETGWTVSAPADTRNAVQAIADIDDDGADEVLLEWRANGRGALRALGNGARPRIVSHQPLMPRLGPPIAADLHGRGRLSVLATSAVDEVVAIAPPTASKPSAGPRELWRHPGRGTNRTNSLAAADLDGDGECEVPVVGESPTGQARISALDGDGKTIWHRDFDEVHGQRYIFRMGGISHLFTGRLTDPGRSDVYVSLLRSIMHSDIGIALRGTDGALLWRRDKASNMGYAGSGLAFADPDGDGLDDIFCGYPICYWRADGTTGEVLFFNNPGDVLPGWPAYAVPVVTDFDGDGEAEAFFPSQYTWGLLDIDGAHIWNLEEGDLPSGLMPGIGDVDGDGKLEIGAPFRDGFRCYDAATGELRWKIAVPGGPYAGILSADVDGDGSDEFLFAAGQRVVAVGASGGSGRIVWEAEFPARVSEPSFADVDGDGLGEVLLTCADGNLYCLGSAE